ncbi:DUF2637 domain-containing protein [Cellulosimicrobium composti]|uniref:DUF2637 domain-containing protein n=1 Tax=Cellulosimicrobium composti TaxID=2672572 RepID=UPI0037AD0D4B
MTTTPRPTTSARINPDTRGALVLAMLATSLLVAISFTLSFAGLSALAPWAAVPRELAPLVPAFIDGAILVYTYSALAARARHESTIRPWTWVALWTAVSASANAAHAWSAGPGGWEGIVGAVLAGLFPIGSLLGCHEIAHRMIARPDAADTDTASAGQAVAPAVVGDVAPVTLVVERAPKPRVVDTEAPGAQTDGGYPDSGRTRTAPRGRVSERLDEIDRLALTTDMSGRAIADELGLGRTSVCARVSAVRAGRTDARTPDTDAVLLAV